MTFRQLTEGMQILAKYLPEGENTIFGGADHEILFICESVTVSPEDAKKLEELRFIVNEQDECWIHFV